MCVRETVRDFIKYGTWLEFDGTTSKGKGLETHILYETNI